MPVIYHQKQPPRGVLRKRCSENIQQIWRRTLMPKCGFNKAALQLYWNRTPAWVFSCKFVVYFQNTFSLETPLDGCFWYVSPKRTPWCIWRFIPGNKCCIYILLMVSFILTSKRISIISFSVTTCFFIQKRRVFINAKCIRWNYICYSACKFAQPWSILEAAVRKCSSK